MWPRLQNIKESGEQLAAIIEAWGVADRVDRFFEDLEQRAQSLRDDDRKQLLARVLRARSLVGNVDALERLLA
jgi:hypothetical protein